ncbi:hypothetical protein FB45DRAFT_875978 [Roridomyces roridus]|uniref:Uncharacterized protein n=1 Tax=Roridomyces roridus TaxID=1738132 RepID=A0AAD7B476_9AGAR|nr:hypothetical protein FB45DRAFT_875978 [Roridomyces roridus]
MDTGAKVRTKEQRACQMRAPAFAPRVRAVFFQARLSAICKFKSLARVLVAVLRRAPTRAVYLARTCTRTGTPVRFGAVRKYFLLPDDNLRFGSGTRSSRASPVYANENKKKKWSLQNSDRQRGRSGGEKNRVASNTWRARGSNPGRCGGIQFGSLGILRRAKGSEEIEAHPLSGLVSQVQVHQILGNAEGPEPPGCERSKMLGFAAAM